MRSGSARLDSVAHDTKARKSLVPLVARSAADDSQSIGAVETQPLNDGDRRIVLAADRIDPRLITGGAVDADRLGHRHPPAVNPGNRGRRLFGEAGAVVGRL